ncbi:hypothetical protein MA16_Dca010181 [Dendrobium catenatum]|uniref:Uncharacterized protein n=1 Tax=Dendrobium catenatum TaxID=906689 RepID=A0A2I0WAC7_9ASPA|nr:hypothetical protein MA16_Dca010181 [Dendrobium catenatum]
MCPCLCSSCERPCRPRRSRQQASAHSRARPHPGNHSRSRSLPLRHVISPQIHPRSLATQSSLSPSPTTRSIPLDNFSQTRGSASRSRLTHESDHCPHSRVTLPPVRLHFCFLIPLIPRSLALFWLQLAASPVCRHYLLHSDALRTHITHAQSRAQSRPCCTKTNPCRYSPPFQSLTEAESITEEDKANAISSVIDRRNVYERETPLHLAIKLGDATAVEMLMAAGADSSLQNMQGCSPVQEAICAREEQIAKIIAQHY